VESNKYLEDPARGSNHCLRSSGTERAWFFNREEAERFAASPANPAYKGDVAHECVKCGFYHLSKPSWLEPEFTPADLHWLKGARIQATSDRLRCTVCGCAQREGADFFILPSGALRCTACLEA
jgi:hypothetical protein